MKGKNRLEFGVKALILRDSKFLVMHNNGVRADLWELPGGRMEFGETAEETLKREIMEETGLIVNPIKLLDTWNLIKVDHQITGIIYLCSIEEGEITLSDEHDAYKWVNADKESLDIMYDVFKIPMEKWDWNKICKEYYRKGEQ